MHVTNSVCVSMHLCSVSGANYCCRNIYECFTIATIGVALPVEADSID